MTAASPALHYAQVTLNEGFKLPGWKPPVEALLRLSEDFAAVQEIHQRILQVREKGGAVLLISEDLDELLELADRIVVMSEGRIVHDVVAAREAAAADCRARHAALVSAWPR